MQYHILEKHRVASLDSVLEKMYNLFSCTNYLCVYIHPLRVFCCEINFSKVNRNIFLMFFWGREREKGIVIRILRAVNWVFARRWPLKLKWVFPLNGRAWTRWCSWIIHFPKTAITSNLIKSDAGRCLANNKVKWGSGYSENSLTISFFN